MARQQLAWYALTYPRDKTNWLTLVGAAAENAFRAHALTAEERRLWHYAPATLKQWHRMTSGGAVAALRFALRNDSAGRAWAALQQRHRQQE